jgi:hypothetical protein
MNFCKGKQGQRFPTIGGKAWFTLRLVENDALHYIVESSGKEHRNARSSIEKIIQRYAETKSWKPSDYKDVTWNASWTLRLLKLYTEYSGKIPQEGISAAEFVEQVKELLRRYDEKG